MNEVIIDTNILARYLVQDTPRQTQQAKKLIRQVEQKKVIGLISILVVDELIWLLENYYNLKKENFLPLLIKLFSLSGIRIIEIEKRIILAALMEMQTKNVDFTDLYLFIIAGDKKIISFDKDFKKLRGYN